MKTKAVSNISLIDTSHSPNTLLLKKFVMYDFSTSSEVKRFILVECGSGFDELVMPLPFSAGVSTIYLKIQTLY
jgi:hypothetical protein